MKKRILKGLYSCICAALIVQLTGCGTIMYPERKGQKSGKIDTQVAILDGLGLFFFFIPGVIAFAVDFSNGTIYLPNSSKSSFSEQDMKQVKFNPKNYTDDRLEAIIEKEIGQDIEINEKGVEVLELGSIEEMTLKFAEVFPMINGQQMVSVINQ